MSVGQFTGRDAQAVDVGPRVVPVQVLEQKQRRHVQRVRLQLPVAGLGRWRSMVVYLLQHLGAEPGQHLDAVLGEVVDHPGSLAVTDQAEDAAQA